eukprot:TRINITY_DN18706_c0_g1_i1.p1 TRINITY_DN18706_c0_g1~~TRINITY_DN18706_c0_g1_i1.p1  ORF type:complete len:131 (+),score=29.99 TRINITY_DN18706_c0_g1_i1:88-480(+)
MAFGVQVGVNPPFVLLILSIVLIVLGFFNFITIGWGLLVGLGMIVLGVLGIVGTFCRWGRALWIFFVASLVLLVIDIIYIIVWFVDRSSGPAIALYFIEALFMAACAACSFVVLRFGSKVPTPPSLPTAL